MFGRKWALKYVSWAMWITLLFATVSIAWWCLRLNSITPLQLPVAQQLAAVNLSSGVARLIAICFPFVVLHALASKPATDPLKHGKRVWRLTTLFAFGFAGTTLLPWIVAFPDHLIGTTYYLAHGLKMGYYGLSGDAFADLARTVAAVFLLAGILWSFFAPQRGRALIQVGAFILMAQIIGVALILFARFTELDRSWFGHALPLELTYDTAEQMAVLGECLLFPLALRTAIRLPDVKRWLDTSAAPVTATEHPLLPALQIPAL